MEQAPILDRVLGYVWPGWAASRAQARAKQAYFDAAGRAFDRHGLGMSYRGGVSTRVDDRYTGSYSQTGVRSPSNPQLLNMRDRARNLVRNNVLASALLNASTNFVIGAGTRIEPTTTDPEFNDATKDMWEDWWYGRDGSSPDVRGLSHGPELERLLFLARLRDGDCGAILLDDGRIQVIEGDLISTPDKLAGQKKIADGVELDSRNRPIRFHIRTIDETKTFSRNWTPVNAEDFIYLPRLKSPSQVRGETAFAQSFGLFEQMDGYVEAVVLAARMAAMFGLLITEAAPTFASLPTTADSSGKVRPALDLEPAMVKYISAGDKVEQIRPEQPTTQFEQFLVSLVRLSGLELALPLEVSLLDFSRTTYSSARASMIVAQRAALAEHTQWSCRFMSRLYRWRVSKWIKEGELNAPQDEMPWRHRAIQHPHDYLDPVKDVQGRMLEIDAGLRTLSESHNEYGGSFDEYLTTRGAELAKLESAGIEVSKSVLTRDEPTSGAGNGQSPEETIPSNGRY